jgi:hypothetical protein
VGSASWVALEERSSGYKSPDSTPIVSSGMWLPDVPRRNPCSVQAVETLHGAEVQGTAAEYGIELGFLARSFQG